MAVASLHFEVSLTRISFERLVELYSGLGLRPCRLSRDIFFRDSEIRAVLLKNKYELSYYPAPKTSFPL